MRQGIWPMITFSKNNRKVQSHLSLPGGVPVSQRILGQHLPDLLISSPALRLQTQNWKCIEFYSLLFSTPSSFLILNVKKWPKSIVMECIRIIEFWLVHHLLVCYNFEDIYHSHHRETMRPIIIIHSQIVKNCSFLQIQFPVANPRLRGQSRVKLNRDCLAGTRQLFSGIMRNGWMWSHRTARPFFELLAFVIYLVRSTSSSSSTTTVSVINRSFQENSRSRKVPNWRPAPHLIHNHRIPLPRSSSCRSEWMAMDEHEAMARRSGHTKTKPWIMEIWNCCWDNLWFASHSSPSRLWILINYHRGRGSMWSISHQAKKSQPSLILWFDYFVSVSTPPPSIFKWEAGASALTQRPSRPETSSNQGLFAVEYSVIAPLSLAHYRFSAFHQQDTGDREIPLLAHFVSKWWSIAKNNL